VIIAEDADAKKIFAKMLKLLSIRKIKMILNNKVSIKKGIQARSIGRTKKPKKSLLLSLIVKKSNNENIMQTTDKKTG
jgi:hypothetical protein